MLDDELRMSYRHNIHNFGKGGKDGKSKHDISKQNNEELASSDQNSKYMMCKKCQKKYGKDQNTSQLDQTA